MQWKVAQCQMQDVSFASPDIAVHIVLFCVRNLRSSSSATWKRRDRRSSLCRTCGLWFTTSL